VKKSTAIIGVLLLMNLFFGCTSETSSGQVQEDGRNETSSVLESNNKVDPAIIDYSDLEEFVGKDDIYRFKVPKGLFARKGDNFLCKSLDATIDFELHYHHIFDGEESEYFRIDDLYSQYKGRMKSTYSVKKDDFFVLSGYRPSNEIVYLKAFYEELETMRGGEDVEPSYLWSKAGVLIIEYPESSKEEFKQLIPIIMKSFSCDFILL
jgi:hypothetical protein